MPEANPARWSGTETCGHCLQTHHVTLERYCAACDGPVCALCVVVSVETAALLCPGCAPRSLRRAPRRKRR
ncbi:MAG TPA: hypothetical protein VFT98_09590 [Myxococcota bacterium]|nr:hypothetical protein [Myxococcota bacterium]